MKRASPERGDGTAHPKIARTEESKREDVVMSEAKDEVVAEDSEDVATANALFNLTSSSCLTPSLDVENPSLSGSVEVIIADELFENQTGKTSKPDNGQDVVEADNAEAPSSFENKDEFGWKTVEPKKKFDSMKAEPQKAAPAWRGTRAKSVGPASSSRSLQPARESWADVSQFESKKPDPYLDPSAALKRKNRAFVGHFQYRMVAMVREMEILDIRGEVRSWWHNHNESDVRMKVDMINNSKSLSDDAEDHIYRLSHNLFQAVLCPFVIEPVLDAGEWKPAQPWKFQQWIGLSIFSDSMNLRTPEYVKGVMHAALTRVSWFDKQTNRLGQCSNCLCIGHAPQFCMRSTYPNINRNDASKWKLPHPDIVAVDCLETLYGFYWLLGRLPPQSKFAKREEDFMKGAYEFWRRLDRKAGEQIFLGEFNWANRVLEHLVQDFEVIAKAMFAAKGSAPVVKTTVQHEASDGVLKAYVIDHRGHTEAYGKYQSNLGIEILAGGHGRRWFQWRNNVKNVSGVLADPSLPAGWNKVSIDEAQWRTIQKAEFEARVQPRRQWAGWGSGSAAGSSNDKPFEWDPEAAAKTADERVVKEVK